MARLIVNDGSSSRNVELVEAITVAGRSADNKIHIDDRQASRRHFQIEKTEFGFKLVDLESRNGTKVNDKVVNQALLRPGDRITIGKHTLTFEDPNFQGGAPEPSRPVPPPPSARPVPPPSAGPAPAPVPAPAPASPAAQAESRAPRRTSTGNTTAMVINRTARVEQMREQQMIRWVGVGAGLFIAILVILIVASGNGPGSTPSDQEYDRAYTEYKRKQYDKAREILTRIPAEPKAAHDKAVALLKTIEDEQKRPSVPSEAETRDIEALTEFCEKNKSTPASYDRILSLCSEFRKKYPSSISLPKVEQYVKAVTESRQSVLGKEIEVAIAATLEQAQRKDYAGAVKAANGLITKYTDVDARPRLVKLHDDVVDQAQEHFKSGQAKAKEAAAAGNKDEAARIYESLVSSLGDGMIDELSVWAEIARTALKGLK